MSDPRPPARPETGSDEVLDSTPERADSDAARRLAEEARENLLAEGYSDSRIRQWAEEYVSEEDASADLPAFLTWVARRS